MCWYSSIIDLTELLQNVHSASTIHGKALTQKLGEWYGLCLVCFICVLWYPGLKMLHTAYNHGSCLAEHTTGRSHTLTHISISK